MEDIYLDCVCELLNVRRERVKLQEVTSRRQKLFDKSISAKALSNLGLDRSGNILSGVQYEYVQEYNNLNVSLSLTQFLKVAH